MLATFAFIKPPLPAGVASPLPFFIVSDAPDSLPNSCSGYYYLTLPHHSVSYLFQFNFAYLFSSQHVARGKSSTMIQF